VANLARSLGLLEQVQLVAGLRWRIFRNNLRQKNFRLDLIGLISAGLFSGVLVVGFCFAFYSGTRAFLSSGRLGWIALPLWAIFLWWQVFPIIVAGFGANFEFRALLRFPLKLSAFYIIGLSYGLSDFAAIAGVCWLLAMTAGAAAAAPGVLPVMLFIVAQFVLLNVTIERLLGSWLERLLARRRSREIFFALFILATILVQFITPLVNSYGKVARPSVFRLVHYLALLPPSLAGRAITGAASHRSGDELKGAAGLVLFVLFFSALLWNRLSSQYRGEELSETSAPAPAAARPSAPRIEQGGTLGLLSPQVAAVVGKEFRYLMRNVFAFFTLLMPPLLILLLSSQITSMRTEFHERRLAPDSLFPGMMAYLILILMAPAYNAFAYEGRGVQAYFTAPLRFRDVFFGKNLMLVGVLVVEIALSILVLAFRVGLPSAPIFIASLAAMIFIVAGQLTIANWSSLSFPRKLQFGQLRGQRQSGMAVLLVFGVQIVFGAISTLILFTGRWTRNPWLPAETFAFLAAAVVGGYFASLDALTDLAERKKEILIEALCR
jgi:ABC-2 type transport system permease protein